MSEVEGRLWEDGRAQHAAGNTASEVTTSLAAAFSSPHLVFPLPSALCNALSHFPRASGKGSPAALGHTQRFWARLGGRRRRCR